MSNKSGVQLQKQIKELKKKIKEKKKQFKKKEKRFQTEQRDNKQESHLDESKISSVIQEQQKQPENSNTLTNPKMNSPRKKIKTNEESQIYHMSQQRKQDFIIDQQNHFIPDPKELQIQISSDQKPKNSQKFQIREQNKRSMTESPSIEQKIEIVEQIENLLDQKISTEQKQKQEYNQPNKKEEIELYCDLKPFDHKAYNQRVIRSAYCDFKGQSNIYEDEDQEDYSAMFKQYMGRQDEQSLEMNQERKSESSDSQSDCQRQYGIDQYKYYFPNEQFDQNYNGRPPCQQYDQAVDWGQECTANKKPSVRKNYTYNYRSFINSSNYSRSNSRYYQRPYQRGYSKPYYQKSYSQPYQQEYDYEQEYEQYSSDQSQDSQNVSYHQYH